MSILRGVCPVLETPFHADGRVDESGFVALAHAVSGAGGRQVMFPGYASEFYKLTDFERDRLMRLLLAQAPPSLQVIVSIPDHATVIAVERATEAVALGAAGINILPPYLLAPDPATIREHVRAIAEAVPETPVVVQYAPAQTGTALSAQELSAMAARCPNISAVKVESVPPGRFISALADAHPALPAAIGYGGVQMIDGMQRGAVAVQPGSSFVELYCEVWDGWQYGDRNGAILLHQRMLPYLSYWMQSVELIIAAEKRISMLRGIIGSDHCRAPARALDTEELRMIDRFLDEFAGKLRPEH